MELPPFITLAFILPLASTPLLFASTAASSIPLATPAIAAIPATARRQDDEAREAVVPEGSKHWAVRL